MSAKNLVNKKNIFFTLFTLFLLITDQISKQLVILRILPGKSTPVVDEFIYFTPVKNKGLIMNLFPNLIYLPVFLTIFLAIVFIYLWLLKPEGKGKLGISFIISGAAGNLLDRVFRGGVIDFIDVKFWPIFNLADIFITVGTVLLCLNLIFSRKPQGFPSVAGDAP